MKQPSPSAAAMASAVASASNARCVPTTARPARRPSAPCSASHGAELPGLQRAAAHVEALVDLGVGRRQRIEQPVAQDPELEVVEQPVDLVAVPRLHAQRVRRLGQRHVLDQFGQIAVEDDVERLARNASPTLPRTASTLSTSACSEPYSMIHFDAVFSPTPGDAGQVVARIAAQRREVGVLGRGSARTSRHDGLGREPRQLADALDAGTAR